MFGELLLEPLLLGLGEPHRALRRRDGGNGRFRNGGGFGRGRLLLLLLGQLLLETLLLDFGQTDWSRVEG